MAGRPPLPIGSHGKVRTNDVTKPGGPKTFRAYCQFRDLDGTTRQVSASGSSGAAAQRNLKAAIANRAGTGAEGITPDTRVRAVAEQWFATITAQVESGDRSPGTRDQYRSLLDRHVLPAVGELRLREATTGRIDNVLQVIRERAGAPTAKSCRTVISGVLGFAARHDAVATNATRNTQPISVKPRHKPRALTSEECTRWLARLGADERAVQRDLVDLTGMLLAVGCRIGEGLAIAWDDLNLDVGTVAIDWTVCRVKGRPLFRKRVKTDAGFRTLPLPPFAVAMLRRRAVEQHVLRTGALPDGVEVRDDGEFTLTEEIDAGKAAAALGQTPVFPDSRGGWRDPSNTRRDLRDARGTEEFEWVTSHVFRKTAATLLDEAGLSAREIADQLGHSRPSMSQDVYMARKVTSSRAALALEQALRVAFPMH